MRNIVDVDRIITTFLIDYSSHLVTSHPHEGVSGYFVSRVSYKQITRLK